MCVSSIIFESYLGVQVVVDFTNIWHLIVDPQG